MRQMSNPCRSNNDDDNNHVNESGLEVNVPSYCPGDKPFDSWLFQEFKSPVLGCLAS